MTNTKCGTLYIVATPIGNLSDISQHALDILSDVDLIVAEDTRHSKRLLEHYEIQASMTSLHNFNESSKSDYLIQKLQSGLNLALISDAGTPLISDPGYHFVKDARQADLTVTPIPGCSAIITALCASGLATDKFCFEGFLPAKPGTRLNSLKELVSESRTLCFYEAPHRLLKSLSSMLEAFGPKRKVVVAKELTKAFERFFTGSLEAVINQLESLPDVIRGEFVILLEGAPEAAIETKEITPFMQLLIDENLPTKQAASIAAKWLGCKKKEAYKVGLSLQSSDND